MSLCNCVTDALLEKTLGKTFGVLSNKGVLRLPVQASFIGQLEL